MYVEKQNQKKNFLKTDYNVKNVLNLGGRQADQTVYSHETMSPHLMTKREKEIFIFNIRTAE